MKALLDSHVFLWAISGDPRLSSAHRRLFVGEGNDLYLSLASVWEILIKASLGKIQFPAPAAQYIEKQMERNRLLPLAIHFRHLSELEAIPPIHRDPFDRILIAQSRAEKMPIASNDSIFREYRVDLI